MPLYPPVLSWKIVGSFKMVEMSGIDDSLLRIKLEPTIL